KGIHGYKEDDIKDKSFHCHLHEPSLSHMGEPRREVVIVAQRTARSSCILDFVCMLKDGLPVTILCKLRTCPLALRNIHNSGSSCKHDRDQRRRMWQRVSHSRGWT